MTGKTPDITPAQVVAVLGSIVGQLVAFGLLTTERSQMIVGLASIVVPFGWLVADAIIRHGRSRAMTSASAATIHVTPNQPAKP